MATKNTEWQPHKGKHLMTAGLVLLVIGILRYYQASWPVVLIVLGAVLMVKGAIIKTTKE